MIVKCKYCELDYDDTYRWTLCPHNWLHSDPDCSIKDEARRGDWIQTYTGKKVYVLDPRPEVIDIFDIAHSLAHVCRFGGHSKFFYSVAQHSVLVSQVCRREHAMTGLLHDAAEAYIGDVVRPLKQALLVYSQIEKNWNAMLEYKYPVKLLDLPKDVKQADQILLATERRDVMTDGPGHERWSLHESPMKEFIVSWTPIQARDIFLDRWVELGGRR